MREENQRVERRCIPRIARQILDPFPRTNMTGRLKLRDRENKNCGGENFVRSCALVSQRAFGIIHREKWVAPASSKLAGQQDVDWRRALPLSKQLINLRSSRCQFTGGESGPCKVAAILNGKAMY